ncbi:aldo/keto reductase [Halopenitus salinus]|uniref:Aldo/keto reductase n=1 Tax=Halopenitus salinus TaxID=1198295 RepID=A0ABD5UTY6_9EURY
MSVPTTTLPSGDELPQIGFGTWNIPEGDVADAVRTAIDAGYTHIDTAEGYQNEAGIGEALADYDREDLFVTSKVLPSNLNYESLIESCEASLDRLGTDYLDLFLIHWPNPAISLRETFQAMERLHERGLIRNIGVSNFSQYQLSAAHHIADFPIAVNQFEYHPWFQRPGLVEYCEETDTVIEAAAPLSRSDVFDDEVVRELSETYDVSPAQVVLRWAMDNDVVVIPKSSSPDHIRDNLESVELELDDSDRRRLDERDRDRPCYDTGPRDWTRDVYGISE